MILDREEQQIRNAFTQIKVDTSRLERKVKFDMKNKYRITKPTPRRSFGLAVAAAFILMTVVAGTVYAASIGAFDRFDMFGRFIEDHDPAFGNIVEPVEEEIYAEDQGLRMEVLAARQFYDMAIIYLSLQDITGENRLTEQTSFWPSMCERLIERMHSDDEMGIMVWPGMGSSTELIYFNQETNTAYFEVRVETCPEYSILGLVVERIQFDSGRIYAEFPIPLSSITDAPTMELPAPDWELLIDIDHDRERIESREIVLYDTPGRMLTQPEWEPNVVLVPNRASDSAALPILNDAQHWVSGVAIIDGYLHIQTASTEMSTFFPILIAPDGTDVFPTNQTWFAADENFEILADIIMRGMDDYRHYHFAELVFPINVNELESYLITLMGWSDSSIEGRWEMTVYTDDASDQVRFWEGSVTMGDYILERFVLNPLGLRFEGSTQGTVMWSEMWSAPGDTVKLETPVGIIQLGNYHEGWGFSVLRGATETSFNGFATSNEPIDVASVTAVIIDEVRIPIQ